MKTTLFRTLLSALLITFLAQYANAQGIVINKTNGQKIYYKASEVESVGVYGYGENPGPDPQDDQISAQDFAKLLTSTAWAGTHQAQHNNGSSWSSSAPQNVVIRFDRATNTATSGTGMQIEFSDASLDESKFERMTTITWQLIGEEMTINYDAGWDKAYMKYTDKECHINENAFSGIFYTSYSHRFLFNYGRSNFNEWNKYRNR